MQNKNTKVTSLLSNEEGGFLKKSAKQTENLKGVAVEIGSFLGKSTIFIAKSKGKTYAIDPHKGNIAPNIHYKNTLKEFKENIRKAGLAKKVIPIVKTSQDASLGWNKKIRFLFIDGLHDHANAEQDFRLWSKHLVDGGIVAMHDSYLHWCGSEDVAMEKIVNSPKFYKIGTKGSIVYGIKGKGTILDRITKLFTQLYIISIVYLNRSVILLHNILSHTDDSAPRKHKISTI